MDEGEYGKERMRMIWGGGWLTRQKRVRNACATWIVGSCALSILFACCNTKDYNEQTLVQVAHTQHHPFYVCKMVVIMCPTPAFD